MGAFISCEYRKKFVFMFKKEKTETYINSQDYKELEEGDEKPPKPGTLKRARRKKDLDE